MPRNRKPELYSLLKQTGAPLTTTYAQYKTADLERELLALGVDLSEVATTEPLEPLENPVIEPLEPLANPDTTPLPPLQLPDSHPDSEYKQLPPDVPRMGDADPAEMPGQRLNTKSEEEPIRIDDMGRAWYQEEVKKPAYPKPRGRRVLKYMERGVETKTVQNGEYVETFEVAGEGTPRPAEVKITLPSYQVGIYKDPRFPFRIHCYNGREGFNLFEVDEYYGGAELVPEMCKRVYIENDLCYDVRSVVRAIQAEHRQLQLTGRI